jgi:hypothetical protein
VHVSGVIYGVIDTIIVENIIISWSVRTLDSICLALINAVASCAFHRVFIRCTV